jgi:hypothetical protein
MPEPLFALSVGTPVLGYMGDSTARSSIAPLKNLLPNSVIVAIDVEESLEEIATWLSDRKRFRGNRQDRIDEFGRSPLANPAQYAETVDRVWQSMVEQGHRR